MRRKKQTIKSSSTRGASNAAGEAKKKMMEKIMAQKTGKQVPPMTPEEKIKEEVARRADERLMQKFADRSDKFKKYMKDQIEANAEAREQARRKKATMVIKPRSFKSGKLSSNGKIYDKNFKVILVVGKDGIIRNNMGMKVGKYDPSSPSKTFKLEQLVEKYANKKGWI